MKTVTAVLNERHSGIEVYFDGSPGRETTGMLKKEGWRWNPKKFCWYHIDTYPHREFVRKHFNISADSKYPFSSAKAEENRSWAYEKIWKAFMSVCPEDAAGIIDYYDEIKNQAQAAVALTKQQGDANIISNVFCPRGDSRDNCIERIRGDLFMLRVVAEEVETTEHSDYKIYYRDGQTIRISIQDEGCVVRLPIQNLYLNEEETDALKDFISINMSCIKLLQLPGKSIRESFHPFAAWLLSRVEQGPGNVETEEVFLDDFVVRGNTFRCRKENHTIIPIRANFRILRKNKSIDEYAVLGGYCKECRQYFILNSQYEELCQQGRPLCTVVEEDAYVSGAANPFQGRHWKEKSILKAFGYSAGETSGLSTSERQKILSLVIDNAVLDRSAVISYLDFFIDMHQADQYEVARRDWEEDRRYVSGYHISSFPTVNVQLLRKNNYIPHFG